MNQFDNKTKWVTPELNYLNINYTYSDNCTTNYPTKLNTNPNDGQYSVAGDPSSSPCGSS